METRKPPSPFSRRRFFKLTAAGVAAALGTLAGYGCTFTPLAASSVERPEIEIPAAKARVAGDPLLCVGCRLCELACSTYNEGVSNPRLARLRIDRLRDRGLWSDGLFIPEVCYQCDEPSCLIECNLRGAGAITVDEERETLARVVNEEKCPGTCIDVCRDACPWRMPSLGDRVAIKCNLCGGDPQCVKVCPTGALKVLYA